MSSKIPPCIDYIGAGVSYACAGARCEGDDAAAFRVSCHRRRLAAGQHLFVQGDPRRQVHLVRSGLLRLYKLLRNGRRQVVGFRFAGDFVDLARDSRHRLCAQAVAATELRWFALPEFQSFAASDARVAYRLLDAVSADLSRVFDLTVTVGQRSAEGSLAAFLLDLEARIARRAESGLVPLPMLRSDIADYLGLTQETVSRVFGAFKARGLVEFVGLRSVRLLQHAALRALANGPSDEHRASHSRAAVRPDG